MKAWFLVFLAGVLLSVSGQENTAPIALPSIDIEVGPGELPEWENLAPPPALPALPDLRPSLPAVPGIDPADPLWSVLPPQTVMEEWETALPGLQPLPNTLEGLVLLGYGLDAWSLARVRLLGYGEGPSFLAEGTHESQEGGTPLETSRNTLRLQARSPGGSGWFVHADGLFHIDGLQDRSQTGYQKSQLFRGGLELGWEPSQGQGWGFSASGIYGRRLLDFSEQASDYMSAGAQANVLVGHTEGDYWRAGAKGTLEYHSGAWKPSVMIDSSAAWKPSAFSLTLSGSGTYNPAEWLGSARAELGYFPFPFQSSLGLHFFYDRPQNSDEALFAGWEPPLRNEGAGYFSLGWSSQVEENLWLRASWKYSQFLGWSIPRLSYAASASGLPFWTWSSYDRRLSELSLGATAGPLSWDLTWVADLQSPANGQVPHAVEGKVGFQWSGFSLDVSGLWESDSGLPPLATLKLSLEPFPQLILSAQARDFFLFGDNAQRVSREGKVGPGIGGLVSIQYHW